MATFPRPPLCSRPSKIPRPANTKRKAPAGIAGVDILIDRIDKKQFIDRDFREILKRIQNAGKDKKTSKTVRKRLRELSEMR
jgi:hypothetical protein